MQALYPYLWLCLRSSYRNELFVIWYLIRTLMEWSESGFQSGVLFRLLKFFHFCVSSLLLLKKIRVRCEFAKVVVFYLNLFILIKITLRQSQNRTDLSIDFVNLILPVI